jgi:hypothetical protein
MNLKNSYWFWFNIYKAVFGQQPLVSRSKAVSFLINNYAVASTYANGDKVYVDTIPLSV